jgi:cytohesin
MDADQPPPTPLLAALYAKDLDAARALVAAGEDPTAADTRYIGQGWTPLHFAAAAGDVELVRALLSAGAAVDARSVYGQTPLWWACNVGHQRAAEVLLAAGADPNARSDEGYSPLGRVRRSDPALAEVVSGYGGVV